MTETQISDHRDKKIYDLMQQLAMYVGREPKLADEMNYLMECIRAVETLCDNATGPLDPQDVRNAAEGRDVTVPPSRSVHLIDPVPSSGWDKVSQQEAAEMERDVLLRATEHFQEYPGMAALLRNLASVEWPDDQ